MKIISSKFIAKSVAACALLALGSLAFATSTWDLQAGCSGSNVISEACTGAAAGVTLSGFSNGTGTIASPGATSNTANFAAAAIYNWGSGASSGLGVVAGNESSGDSGPHAFDNAYGIDAMLLTFTGASKINLSGLTIGWNGTDNQTTTNSIAYTDSDLSVFAWTGVGAPDPTAKNPTSLMAGSGWTLVGNYANVGASNNVPTPTPGGSQAVATNIYSSYWMISAYSSAYGTGAGLDQGNDAFKLLTVLGGTCTGTVNSSGLCVTSGGNVPEPGSLALMGAAMMGFVASRRRKSKAV